MYIFTIIIIVGLFIYYLQHKLVCRVTTAHVKMADSVLTLTTTKISFATAQERVFRGQLVAVSLLCNSQLDFETEHGVAAAFKVFSHVTLQHILLPYTCIFFKILNMIPYQ